MISPVIGDAGNVPTVVTKGNGANPSIVCSSCKYGGGRREEMPKGKTRDQSNNMTTPSRSLERKRWGSKSHTPARTEQWLCEGPTL